MLRNTNIKFNLQITPKNKFNFLFAYNNKTRGTRGAADTRPLETTWRQSGPTYLYKFEDTHIVNDNLLFTGRYAYLDMSFALDYQDPSLREIQAKYDYSTGAYADSYLDYLTIRPNHIANFDGNYFLANAIGGDHEFKFGFQYKKAPVESFTTYGGDAWAVSDGGVPLEVWMYRNKAVNYEGTFWALHFQDIFTKGNMTFKLGLRYDYQRGINNESQVPCKHGGSRLDAGRRLSGRCRATHLEESLTASRIHLRPHGRRENHRESQLRPLLRSPRSLLLGIRLQSRQRFGDGSTLGRSQRRRQRAEKRD